MLVVFYLYMKQYSSVYWYGGIMFGLCIQTIGALLYLFFFKEGVVSQIAYGITKLVLVCWPILWAVILAHPFASFPYIQQRYKSIGYGSIFSMVILGVVLLFFYSGLLDTEQIMMSISQKVSDWQLTKQTYILFALFVAFIHSFLEEYYWRWFIFRGLLSKYSLHSAAIVSSLGFMSHHVLVISQLFSSWHLLIFCSVCIAFAGYIWCLLYYRTGSLLGGYISHIVADVVLVYLGYHMLFLS